MADIDNKKMDKFESKKKSMGRQKEEEFAYQLLQEKELEKKLFLQKSKSDYKTILDLQMNQKKIMEDAKKDVEKQSAGFII